MKKTAGCNDTMLTLLSPGLILGTMAELRIRDVPEDIRKAMKIACAKQGISMNARLIELMRTYCEKHGELKK